MMYKQTTQVPNILFDRYLPLLTESELKILLIIIRQTYGWVDKRTKRRKTRDRISHGQFIQKTGLSRRVISKSIKSLVDKGLVDTTCQNGKPLPGVEDRRGQTGIFYSLNMSTQQHQLVHTTTQTSAESAHNKSNYTKINKTKLRELDGFAVKSVADILQSSGYQVNGLTRLHAIG